MLTPPPDLDDAAVKAAVAARWSIVAASLEYAPVGFGSHHWVLTERAGRRWFVTGDAVADSDQRLAGLAAALRTAHALRQQCGLDFVVASLAGVSDGLLSITGRYAIAIYPYLERVTGSPADSRQLLSMITALHSATGDVSHLAPLDDLSIPDRAALDALLADPGIRTDTGPYAAEFADLVGRYRRAIRAALDRYEETAATLGANHQDWVVTHGEPKADNTMITESGPVLVDWDTVQLAPPARDLWMTGSSDSYAFLTGREVPAEQLEFYRLRWDLADLCAFAGWFAGPHRRTADTELAWQGSLSICQRLDGIDF